jgi:hypothetical protein
MLKGSVMICPKIFLGRLRKPARDFSPISNLRSVIPALDHLNKRKF